MRRRSADRVAVVCCVRGARRRRAGDPRRDEVSPRITQIRDVAAGDANASARRPRRAGLRVNAWNQEELRSSGWTSTRWCRSIREPGVSLFYVAEPPRPTGQPAPGSFTLATSRATQVLYTVGELRRSACARQAASVHAGMPGPENDMLKRGAMLHADIAMIRARPTAARASAGRPGPGGFTLFMNDGQQTGRARQRQSLEHGSASARPGAAGGKHESTRRPVPDPGHDETVRRWYLATCAYMARIRQIEHVHFNRALELFPDDPEMLLSAAAIARVFRRRRARSR